MSVMQHDMSKSEDAHCGRHVKGSTDATMHIRQVRSHAIAHALMFLTRALSARGISVSRSRGSAHRELAYIDRPQGRLCSIAAAMCT